MAGAATHGEVAPLIVDLAERGISRIIDIAVMVKDQHGRVAVLDLAALEGGFDQFAGASTGLLDQNELDETASMLESGTSAAMLVWENRWAAPVAVAMRLGRSVAMRRSGGQLVARSHRGPGYPRVARRA